MSNLEEGRKDRMIKSIIDNISKIEDINLIEKVCITVVLGVAEQILEGK